MTAESERPTILHVFPTFAVGGAQRRFAQIADTTDRLFKHVVLAIDGRTEARAIVHGDVTLIEPVSRDGNLPQRIWRNHSALQALRPDLVVTHNWGSIEWAAARVLARKPHIHIEDGFGPDEVHRQVSRRVWFRRLVLRGSQAVVVPSRTLEAIAKDIWLLPARVVRYVPNGIEIADSKASQLLRSDFGHSRGAMVVGWVGALRPEKNFRRLLRAFAELPNEASLVLIGEGPERAKIEAEIIVLGLVGRVHLAGGRSDVGAILPLFDVLALSSDTEQMPLVVLEAMRAGLPVASVDVGDVAVMVAPENRSLIAGRTEVDLARSLGRLAASGELRARLGQANRAYVAGAFPLDRMISTYVELYRSAIAKTARRTAAG